MINPVGNREKYTYTRRIGHSIFVVNLTMVVVGIALIIIRDVDIPASVGGLEAAWPLSAIIYNLLAVLIVSRHPRHTVGWLFFIVGFFMAFVVFINFGSSGLESRIDNEFIRIAVTSFGELAWIVALTVPLTLVLQFFPDGRLPSRSWWPVTVGAVLFILGIFVPYLTEIFGFGLDIEINDSLQALLDIILALPGLVGIVGSLAAVMVRYRRSSGHERTQMKWLVYTAVLGISLSFILIVFLSGNDEILGIYFTTLPTMLAVAIGIAILRHRLFDIDVIIRRTLQYAILTGILALIYFGLVITLQSAFSTVGNQQSPFFIVLSTLVIASLFNPLRLRIQEIIDRRFYRKKYESEQAIAQFTAAARDKVDLNELSHALMAVVQETIQPEHISLWLASSEKENSI